MLNGQSNQDSIQEEVMKAVTQALTLHASQIPDPEDVTVGTLEKWGKWIYGVVGVLVVCFVAGWQAFATAETFVVHEDLEPVKKRVTAVEQNIETVSKGVETLVEINKAQAEYKTVKRKVERRKQEYTEALQEYTADKAAGKSSRRPVKAPELQNLEDDLLMLESNLQTKEASLLED